jgi:hypothetical protein
VLPLFRENDQIIITITLTSGMTNVGSLENGLHINIRWRRGLTFAKSAGFKQLESIVWDWPLLKEPVFIILLLLEFLEECFWIRTSVHNQIDSIPNNLHEREGHQIANKTMPFPGETLIPGHVCMWVRKS